MMTQGMELNELLQARQNLSARVACRYPPATLGTATSRLSR